MKKEKEGELNALKKDKWLYYKGKAPSQIYKEMPFDLKLTTKEEIWMFIDADEEIRKLRYKIDYMDQVLYFLENVLKQINTRTFKSRMLLNGLSGRRVLNTLIHSVVTRTLCQWTLGLRRRTKCILRFKQNLI